MRHAPNDMSPLVPTDLVRRRNGIARTAPVDARALADQLSEAVRGEVRFDDGSRALYATDGSNYRQVPIGVVIPRDTDDIVHTVETCRRFGAPILGRGGGTSLAGQCCNVAVVIDCSKYLHRIEIDADARRARVEPGVILDHLRNQAERYHLTFGPDPSTHDHCTLGGMIGNNSCGVHSVMAGRTADNVHELEILTYDGLRMRVGPTSDTELERLIRQGGRQGNIYARLKAIRDRYAPLIRARYPKIPRRVSGYNLDELLPENGFNVARALVGTEGTCVMILDATVRLVHSPPVRSTLVLGYPDIYEAADHVIEILGFHPIGLEAIDDRLVNDMRKKKLHPENLRLLPEGKGWLLCEFGGDTREQAEAEARKAMDALKRKHGAPSMKLYDNEDESKAVWKIRESGLGATALVPGQPTTWEGWEDAAVPPDRLGNYLRDFRALLDQYKYGCSLYGHFGQACVHTRIDFDFKTREGIAHYRSFIEHAADLVVKYGGSLSGEHGDGQSRAEMLPKMFGPELIQAFREFKSIWDPEGKMNPGKVVDPYRIDENLRLGADYHPPQPRTHFAFTDDSGSFAQATERCVGVGKCRHTDGGTMCPSFMVTREEMHSTRGRAHLLFEMLQGNPLEGGWKDEHVREALDLCLACKGCKGDCPVNVDMATYKAEFLSHYYEGRLRPITAYSIGLIYWWARLASHMPSIANLVTQTPVLRDVAKALAGIAHKRSFPPFAEVPFTRWFAERAPRNVGREKVLLWPDTFNNYFHPQTAKAAVEVLEAAGYQVTIPSRPLCCGRPLYDYGFLDEAEKLWAQILDSLRPQIEAGMSIVGLEPSCVAAFRDELKELYPHDEDAARLSQQTFTLSEFFEQKASHFRIPQLKRRATVHGHCHHKAALGWGDEVKVLKRLGLDFHVLDSGCCGLAGSFGFEKDHYDISMQIGERALLPSVRSTEKDQLVISDGFSCRTQIEEGTDRRALHLADVILMALREGPDGPSGDYPERDYVQPPPSRLKGALIAGGLVAGVGTLLLWRRLRRR